MQFMPLPTLMFSGGHSYFIQHQAAAFNSTPFYAHACLVPGHVPAKVARFKEHGLWAIEEDAYYTQGQFLYYENTVRTFVRLLEQKSGRVRPLFPCSVLPLSALSLAVHGRVRPLYPCFCLAVVNAFSRGPWPPACNPAVCTALTIALWSVLALCSMLTSFPSRFLLGVQAVLDVCKHMMAVSYQLLHSLHVCVCGAGGAGPIQAHDGHLIPAPAHSFMWCRRCRTYTSK